MKENNEWKLYKDRSAFPHAECFWQKEVQKGVYAEIVKYKMDERELYSTDMRIGLNDNLTIKINIFCFEILDFDYIESKILEVYNKLK
jgi:hypothetical protein